jgi:transposase-like protein
MLLRRDEPTAILVRRFGVSEPTLSKWRNDFLPGRGGQGGIERGSSSLDGYEF